MPVVINSPQADALVDHFDAALREQVENGDLTLPTSDEELRAVAAASVASIVSRQQLLSDRFGRFLSSETARGALKGITRQALKNRADNNRLLRVETADGKKIYPELQFDGEGSIVQGLPKIFQILIPAAADEWTVLYWLTAPLDACDGRTAIEVLRGGSAREVKAILEMAKDDASVWQDVSNGDK